MIIAWHLLQWHSFAMSTMSKDPQPIVQSARLAALAKQFAPSGTKGGWQAIAGKAKGDRSFREAMRLGAEWREKANSEGK